MLSYSENILQVLTGKSSLNDVDEKDLQQLADDYPYFGAAQFLLAKKLYVQKHENYKQAMQKAALHFTDMLWLNYNFSEEDTETINTTTEENNLNDDAAVIDNVNTEPEIENVTEQQEESALLQTDEADDFSEELPETINTITEENIFNDEDAVIDDVNIEPEIENVTEQQEASASLQINGVDDFSEEEIETINTITEENIFNDEDAVIDVNTKPEIENVTEQHEESALSQTDEADENDLDAVSETDDETNYSNETNEKLSHLLKEQAEEFQKPVEEAALPIETVPHHRIDYFESQGIKLDEDKANDKLGAQLKRFTDWLKQMKRISPNLNNLETDPVAESQVQNLAEHSNEPKEVVTEAMAEVLIKQGKPEHAIEIYEKLSFINPSKSAYFAAKIQELKA